jgi:hypothetical protein
MKIFLKIILLICLCLTISCATIPSSKTRPTYNFDFYSTNLSKGLFPEIEHVIKPYKKYLTKDEAQNLSNDVFICVMKYAGDHKLFLFSKPLIQTFGFSNDSETEYLFILRVELHFVDEESSVKEANMINTIIFTKAFLIFSGKKPIGAGI